MSLTPAQLENGVAAAQDAGLLDITASQVLAIWEATAADRLQACEAEIERLKSALDSALDFVVDVINEATPGSIYHTNAVECHRIATEGRASLDNSKEI